MTCKSTRNPAWVAVLGLALTLTASAQPHVSKSRNGAPAFVAAAVPAAPAMETVQVPSHGALLNGIVYVAAGAGPHPAVVLLHGFPGNERNLDLAQAIRRAGWDVLCFNYRGAWGSPGAFSFAHSIEDTTAAVAFLRDPKNAAKLHLDPKRIVLIGHSMGGWMAIRGAAADPSIAAVGLISAADMAGRLPAMIPPAQRSQVRAEFAHALADEGMAPLAGCTPEGLATELMDHAAVWNFASSVTADSSRPVLVMTSDDGLAPADDSFAAGLKTAGDAHVTSAHLSTDHAYSGQRLELIEAVTHWLAALPVAPSADR